MHEPLPVYHTRQGKARGNSILTRRVSKKVVSTKTIRGRMMACRFQQVMTSVNRAAMHMTMRATAV